MRLKGIQNEISEEEFLNVALDLAVRSFEGLFKLMGNFFSTCGFVWDFKKIAAIMTGDLRKQRSNLGQALDIIESTFPVP
jgi:hypothetical protein